MSEKKRFEYRITLKKLSIEHTLLLERLAVRIALCVGGLILLTAIVLSILGR